jgi:transcriptional regulator EpsA
VAPLQIDLSGTLHAESMIRVIEASMNVRRRYQFFVWSQTYVGMLLPHHISVCGSYQRNRKELVFEPFHSVQVPSAALAALCDVGSVLIQQVIGDWIDRSGNASVFDLDAAAGLASAADRDLLVDAGFNHLLVHGVTRPGRPAEIESLFILIGQRQRWTEHHRACLEMVLPYLHSTYLRVQSTEREMGSVPAPVQHARLGERRAFITERERQILAWVREGKSNLEIGVVLDISGLTVKNHVQKILRKLGAANRAQAVAKAMSLNLLGRSGPEGLPEHVDAPDGATVR